MKTFDHSKYEKWIGWQTTAELGRLWFEERFGGRDSSNPFTRQAGHVLHAMKRRGLVCRESRFGRNSTYWQWIGEK